MKKPPFNGYPRPIPPEEFAARLAAGSLQLTATDEASSYARETDAPTVEVCTRPDTATHAQHRAAVPTLTEAAAMTWEQFVDRYAQELDARPARVTGWMAALDLDGNGKDCGFARWQSLTNTPEAEALEQWSAYAKRWQRPTRAQPEDIDEEPEQEEEPEAQLAFSF